MKSIFVNDGYVAYFEKYKQLKPVYSEVYQVVTDTVGDGKKETQLIGIGDLEQRTTENAEINFKSPSQGYCPQVAYNEYTDGVAWSKRMEQDAVKIKALSKKYCSMWAEADVRKRETIAATVFNDGGNTAGSTVFDANFTDNAQNYTAHMIYDSKPMFNLTGNARKLFSQSTGTYYNAVTGLTLTPANFETLYNLATVTNAVNERGQKISFPVDTLLVEQGASFFLAKRILESEQIANSQNNDINPYKGIVSPLAWRYLSDSGAFYVGKRQHEDFQFIVNQAPEIRYFRDERTLEYCASYNTQFGIFVKNFRVWTRGGGTYA